PRCVLTGRLLPEPAPESGEHVSFPPTKPGKRHTAVRFAISPGRSRRRPFRALPKDGYQSTKPLGGRTALHESPSATGSSSRPNVAGAQPRAELPSATPP